MNELIRFQLAAHALNGSGGFETGAFLVQFPRESDDKYARRQKVAWYRNYMKSACEQFVGHLWRYGASRAVSNPLLEVMLKNADLLGNGISTFMQQVAINARARGSMLVAVDMPDVLPQSLHDQIEQRRAPFLTPVYPENIIRFELDETGRFELIEYLDGGSVRYWDKTRWKITDSHGHIREGEHGLNLVPVEVFTEGGAFPHVGSFYQIAELSVRLFNLHSELDEILRAQTFSILTFHAPDPSSLPDEQTLNTLGTSNLLIYSGNRPDFIAPPSGPADIYLKRIEAMEESIREIALDVSGSRSRESGIALQMRFQRLNAELLKYARRLEDFERRLFDLAARWLGLDESGVEISYPKDFNLADIGTEIETLANMQQLGAPAAYQTAKMRQIISLDMPELSEEQRALIEQQLEVVDHAR